jgi:hypothetical protein
MFNFTLFSKNLQHAKKKPDIRYNEQSIDLINPSRKHKSGDVANMIPWTYQRWDQIPERSKHPLSTGHTRLKS